MVNCYIMNNQCQLIILPLINCYSMDDQCQLTILPLINCYIMDDQCQLTILPVEAQLRDDAKAKVAIDDLRHQFQLSSSKISALIRKIVNSGFTRTCICPSNDTAVMGSWLY